MADLDELEASSVSIEDENGHVVEVETTPKALKTTSYDPNGNAQTINADGSTNVNATLSAIPPIPAGATAASDTDFGRDSGVNDKFYIITNGKTLTLQTFSAGAERTFGGSVVELFYAPNGNTTGIVRIGTIYVNGSTNQIGVAGVYTGDGTAAILLRRRRLSGGRVEMEGTWRGYEE